MRLSMIFVLLALLIAACSPSASGADNPLPPGDAARGEQMFNESVNGAPSCNTCHTLDGTVRVGPSLQDYADIAPAHAGDASVENYTRASIVRPAAYIVEGFGNVMYPQYGRQLTPQQIADLIAYLLTL